MNEPSRPPKPSVARDADIAACTIGELEVHNDSILLVDYDPSWPEFFNREAVRIRGALAERAVQLEHVGSTSVPGLSAKPRIDIVLSVADSAEERSYVPSLEEVGYVLRIREPDWYEHRLLKGPDTDVNVHVFSSGCVEVERMIVFRDWLRSHPEDRALYERTKRDLASKRWKLVQNYADAKSEIVVQILSRASAGRG